jgi:hypothetical protein
MGWYFGQPMAYRNSSYPKQYDKGVNFQCPNVFVEHFVEASETLSKRFQSSLASTKTNLIVKPQLAMHISLSYLCCLRNHQVVETLQLMKTWVQERNFDFRVRFDRLECWHERPNSVTNILIVDDNSQHTLMGILRDLELYLINRGIPIIVPRTDQMPFHITIVGVQYNKAEIGESNEPEDEITPRLPEIHSIVSEVDQSAGFRGSAWTSGQELRVKYKPHFSTKGTIHA